MKSGKFNQTTYQKTAKLVNIALREKISRRLDESKKRIVAEEFSDLLGDEDDLEDEDHPLDEAIKKVTPDTTAEKNYVNALRADDSETAKKVEMFIKKDRLPGLKAYADSKLEEESEKKIAPDTTPEKNFVNALRAGDKTSAKKVETFIKKERLAGLRAYADSKTQTNEARELQVPEKHQLKIAYQTLKMSDAGARIMGGMTKEQAREIIKKFTGKTPKE